MNITPQAEIEILEYCLVMERSGMHPLEVQLTQQRLDVLKKRRNIGKKRKESHQNRNQTIFRLIERNIPNNAQPRNYKLLAAAILTQAVANGDKFPTSMDQLEKKWIPRWFKSQQN